MNRGLVIASQRLDRSVEDRLWNVELFLDYCE